MGSGILPVVKVEFKDLGETGFRFTVWARRLGWRSSGIRLKLWAG